MKIILACLCVGAISAQHTLRGSRSGGDAVDFDIPEYGDCDTEHAAYTVAFPHNEALYGQRFPNVDRKQVFCANLKKIVAHKPNSIRSLRQLPMPVD